MNNPTTGVDMLTVGLDLGDRHTQICVLDRAGEIVEEARVVTTASALERRFSRQGRLRVVMEAGTHSPWVSRLLLDLGHEVIVANPRKLRLIYANESKSDRVDALYLARVGRLDPALLSPLTHRDQETQEDLALIRSRTTPVRARTQLVNHVRGTVKSLSGRLPRCAAAVFAVTAERALPEGLRPAMLIFAGSS